MEETLGLVHLWYDSQMTSAEAVKNTQSYIDKKREHVIGAPIFLKDIRSLSTIQKNIDIFSDKTPVYFRADLGRVIAAIKTVKKDGKPFVYADIDVKPMGAKKLFDEQTQKHLAKYGIVMASDPSFGFENRFQITTNKPELLRAMQKTLVKMNIIHAGGGAGKYSHIHPEQIYSTYPFMFKVFYHLNGSGKLQMLEHLNNKDSIKQFLKTSYFGCQSNNSYIFKFYNECTN